MAATFIPRSIFPTMDALPRSYFLGHHRAGLAKMKTMLTSIDMIIECRDYRVPLSSINPLFEQSLAGRERLIVYTKKDLGDREEEADKQMQRLVRQWHTPSKVLFASNQDRSSIRRVLDFAKQHAIAHDSLTGSRMMIVGMPNVGKSTMLNGLRNVGTGRGKAAYTGAQPGITRKITTGVKIVEGSDGREGVYLVDTPGVFVPYVPDAEAMLKLALCGSVKDTIIPATLLADYLLYHINRVDPELYAQYLEPTNDVMPLLECIATKTGRLQKGGVPDTESAALWMIQRWRNGHLGRFVLDEVSEEMLERRTREQVDFGTSVSQARKAERAARTAKTKRRRTPAE